MAKLVMIVGPQAVGKMTVGQELAKITDLKFMHNHETKDVLTNIFDICSKERKRLTDEFRMLIFNEVAKSDLKGLIFTAMCFFDNPSEKEWLTKIKHIFEDAGGEFYMVELEADLEERRRRNVTENRLANKPSKRNIEFSDKELLHTLENHRLNSIPGEITYENYIKINNTNITAEETARMIKEKFKL